MRAPVLAIVGRPNVGKSTLFNRLAGRRIAIVEDLPGVTRDRLYAEHRGDDEGNDISWTIIDTGGFEPEPDTTLFALVREQTELAIEEADVIVHVVDARLGLSPDDIAVAHMLRKSRRPVIVGANKVDHPNHEAYIGELYGMGVKDIFPISAEHGRGIATLMEYAFSLLSPTLKEGARAAAVDEESLRHISDEDLEAALDHAEANLVAMEGSDDEEDGDDGDDEEGDESAEGDAEDGDADEVDAEEGDEEDADDEDADDEIEDDASAALARAALARSPNNVDEDGSPPPTPLLRAVPEVLRLAVVGRPNAGKSSFVNKLLGEERHLVSEVAGTTMDAVDSFVEYGGSRFRVIDTAGIRRKRSIAHRVEKFAVVSALRGMDRADLVLHLIDAVSGVTEQDKRIAAFVEEKGKACVIVINKWDLAKDNDLDADTYAQQVRDAVPFLDHVPIRFISAKTGKRVHDVLHTAQELAKRHFLRVSTSKVNRCLAEAVDAHQPPMHKGRRVRLYFATQVRTAPPTFVVATNDTEGVHWSYRRFLVNRFRDAFDFGGAPVRLIFRRREGDRLKKLSPVQKRNRELKRNDAAEAWGTNSRPRKKGESKAASRSGAIANSKGTKGKKKSNVVTAKGGAPSRRQRSSPPKGRS